MRRRLIAFALLLWYVPACTTWQVQQGVTPQQLIADQHPDAVRVTRPDRSQFVLDQPTAAGDSLTGTVDGKATSVAAADVTRVAIRKVSAGKTVAAIFGAGLVAATIALGVALNNMCILDC